MKKEIELQDKKIEYTLKVSKVAKRVRVAIYCDGSLVVTIPRFASENFARRFMVEKSGWIVDRLEHFKANPQKVNLGGNKKHYAEYKEIARALAHERLAHFNGIYGFKFNTVSIKNQKTCWGSCSRKGNLNFNYKIALIPQRLSDYVIVHELCHLKEFNHSPKFWNLVKAVVPDYLSIRKELKRGGGGLG